MVSELSLWSTDQQYFIEENQSVASTLVDSQATTVEVLRGESMIYVSLSYNQIHQTLRLLKSTTLKELLRNPQCLKAFEWTLSAESCIFIFGEHEREKLRGKDLRQTLEHYASRSKGLLSFEILISVRIIRHRNASGATAETLLELSHRNHTIGELLNMTGNQDGRHHLASRKTKFVYDEDTLLNDLKENEFYLVEDSQTRLVSIEINRTMFTQTNDHQRYMSDATLNDVCTQNVVVETDQFVQCEPDYVPAYETPLRVLTEDPQTPLQLTVVSMRQFVPITIYCSEEKNP